MVTVGTVLDRSRGIGPGFDFLRVFLAAMVVFSHAFLVCGASPESMQSMWFLEYWVLAVFFSLSGFLITGSALRLKLSDFLKNRVLRIVPALAVDIVMSAMILGPLLTSVSLKEYYTSHQFVSYLLNIAGIPHYYLPGVFSDHPFTAVNVSLWTIPWEISCYIIMSILIYFKLISRIPMIAMAAVGLMLLGVAIVGLDNGIPFRFSVGHVIHYFLAQRGARLIICFLLGIVFYQLRYRIPYSYALFVACVVWCAALALIIHPQTPLSTYPVMNVLASVPLVYSMAFIGVSAIPKLPLFDRGDYSYGIYLYGFPIQQVVYGFMGKGSSPIINFVVAMPPILLIAMCSWHFVEKPIVRLRRHFSFVARLRLDELPQQETEGQNSRQAANLSSRGRS